MRTSSWITIDRLGTKGIEPDEMPPHRDPQSLDAAVNVRALGRNLANAGGYRLVANGALPDEETASNCTCPDLHFERSSTDGETYLNQAWWRQSGWSTDPDHWITAFEINAGQSDYDQTLIQQFGECEQNRLQTIQIQVLNTATARKVRLIETNTAGAEVQVHLDHDASAVFGDGQPHWVFVERHHTTNNHDYRIYIDNVSIYNDGFSFQYDTDYLTVLRANSPAGTTLPIVFWSYSASVWSCLISGNYNGLGFCDRTGPQSPIKWDLVRSSADLNYYRGDVVAVPKAGTPTARLAYGKIVPVTTLPVYFEIPRDGPGCRDNSYWGGVAGAAVDLESGGPNPPGTVTGSVGVNRLGDLYIDNAVVAGNVFQAVGWIWLCIAYDPVLGQVWVGNARADGAQEWASNLVPGTDAGFPAVMVNPIPVVMFEDPHEAMKTVGTGSRFALPAGFSYAEPL